MYILLSLEIQLIEIQSIFLKYFYICTDICRLDYNCIFRQNFFEPEFLCKGPANHNLLKFHKITNPQQRNFYIHI